jgi:hypothetical protein
VKREEEAEAELCERTVELVPVEMFGARVTLATAFMGALELAI